LPFLRADKETHIEAARLYHRARARGWTVPAADALIAATAVVHGVALLTADRRHFQKLARVSKLRLAP
jgi:predicted nucleic acid-binding protein